MFFIGKCHTITSFDVGYGRKSKGLLFNLDPQLNYKLYIYDPKYFLKAPKPLPTPGIQYVFMRSTYLDLYLSVTKHQKMNQKTSPCNEDPKYDLHGCVKNSFTRQVGCRPPWDLGNNQDLPICQDLERIRRFEELYISTGSDNLEIIVKQTECLTPCQYKEFKFAAEPDNYEMRNRKAIKLMFPDNEVTIETEVELYNFISLVSDIGGAHGLFLGFSLIMVWDGAEGILRIMRKYWIDKSAQK